MKARVQDKAKEGDISPVSVEVRERDDVVVLIFDKAVAWVGIEPVAAIKLAEQMKAAAVGILRSSPGETR